MALTILGIETSCDETAAGVVEDGRVLRSNIISSQADLHSRYGGVVPEVASRQHVRDLTPVLEQAVQSCGLGLEDIDAVAVTYGPRPGRVPHNRTQRRQGPFLHPGSAATWGQSPRGPYLCLLADAGESGR